MDAAAQRTTEEQRAPVIDLTTRHDAELPPAPRWFGFDGDGRGVGSGRATTELDARRTADLCREVMAAFPGLRLTPGQPRVDGLLRRLISNAADSHSRMLTFTVGIDDRSPLVVAVPSTRRIQPERVAEAVVSAVIVLAEMPRLPVAELRFDHAMPFDSEYSTAVVESDYSTRTVRVNGHLIAGGPGASLLHEKDVFATSEVGALTPTDAGPLGGIVARGIGFIADEHLRGAFPGLRRDLLAGIVEAIAPEASLRAIFPHERKDAHAVGIDSVARSARWRVSQAISSEAVRSEARLFSELFCEAFTAESPRQPARWFRTGIERLAGQLPH